MTAAMMCGRRVEARHRRGGGEAEAERARGAPRRSPRTVKVDRGGKLAEERVLRSDPQPRVVLLVDEVFDGRMPRPASAARVGTGRTFPEANSTTLMEGWRRIGAQVSRRGPPTPYESEGRRGRTLEVSVEHGTAAARRGCVAAAPYTDIEDKGARRAAHAHQSARGRTRAVQSDRRMSERQVEACCEASRIRRRGCGQPSALLGEDRDRMRVASPR